MWMSDLENIKLQEEEALVMRVRTLCQDYLRSAEVVGKEGLSAGQGVRERYEEGRKVVLEITTAITDEFCRDCALQASLDLCMQAADLDYATLVAKAIVTKEIQERVVKDHGTYFVLSKKEGRLISTPAAAIDPSLE
jgi:hypothetical protein